MKTLTYLPVNWINGLKLISQYFFANQYYQTEALNREAERSLTSCNYGPGKVLKGINDDLEIEISGDTMSIPCVRLKSYNAITKGGLPIVYYDGLYGDEEPCATISESGLQAEDSEYTVLISVDPYHLIPVGEPDPEEMPLHHPYVLPSIELHTIPKDQVSKSLYSQNFLLMAEVCRRGSTYKINHQYIPPVRHPVCYDGVKTFISQLARTLQSIREGMKLIYSRNVANKRRDTLANNILELCKAFSAFHNSRILFIEQIVLEQPPTYLVQAVNEFASGLGSALQSLPETEREQLLQYFYEWTSVTPPEFITKIESITKLICGHTNINRSLQMAGAFVTLLSSMFHKMSELGHTGTVHEDIIIGGESHGTTEAQER